MDLRKGTAALVAAVLLLGACSSDDGGEAADKDSTTTEAVETTETTEATDDTADDGGDDMTDDAADDSGDDGSDDSDDGSGDDEDASGDLGDLGQMGECFDASMTWLGVAAAPFLAMDPDLTEEELAEAQAQFEELGSTLPDEIADDIEVMADAFAEFAETFDPDGGMDFEAMAEMGEVFDSPEYTEASENIDAWFAENCEG